MFKLIHIRKYKYYFFVLLNKSKTIILGTDWREDVRTITLDPVSC